jgi:hypothetical protein
MFGVVTFMVREKMCISAGKGRIMCRVDPDVHESALERDGCRPVIMKGRQYRGYVYVDAERLTPNVMISASGSTHQACILK